MMKHPKKVTLSNIADAIGVSKSAVSHVLSNDKNARISEETRKRIIAKAKEMGYRHNLHARTLSTGKSSLVGIVGSGLEIEVVLKKIQAIDIILRKHG